MSWDFEHWDNGKVYLHNERWEEFYKNVNKHGQGYPHNWDHTRVFVCLHTPRDSIEDVPVPGHPNLKYLIESHQEWTMIYQPYPAFIRTEHDPEGWLPSWSLWAEDNQPDGEVISILSTGSIWPQEADGFIRISFAPVAKNHFAMFRNQFWKIQTFTHLGIGSHQPPKPQKKKVLAPRSIFEPFEGSW